MDSVEFRGLCDNLEYINKDEWERMRLQTFILKQNGYLKKNCKIKDFIPFSWEQFKGSTEVDPNMLKWWKKLKTKKRDK